MNKVKSQKGIGIVQLSAILVVFFILLGVLAVVLLGENGLIEQYKTGRIEFKNIVLMQAKKAPKESIPVSQLEENVPLIDENLISQLFNEDSNILLKSLILEYKVNNNEKVTLPIGKKYYDSNFDDVKDGTCNLIVDWGDESTDTIIDVNDEKIVHTYEKEGIYDIKLVGTLDSLSNENIDSSNLIEVKQWGKLDLKNISLKNSKNLINISNPTLSSFNELKYISFEGCEKIKSIPNLFLVNAQVLNNCNNLFYGCEDIKQIPGNLFRNCLELKNASGTFGECVNIEKVPNDLFKYSIHISDFSKLFFMCDLIQEIPDGIFNSNDAVTFESTFARCTSIKSIPENLFKNCNMVENFNGTFSDCRNLEKIPDNLFANNSKVKTFNKTFNNCTSLNGISDKLFDANTETISFQETFANCINIRGKVPQLWKRVKDDADYIGTPNGKACYNNCTKVSKYKEIPSYWINY